MPILLYWLGEALKKEHCALHAYALMTNHVHLLVTPDQADAISRLIIALGRRFYLAIVRDNDERRVAYRDLFRAQLNRKAIDDIRLALNQNQPLGDSRFYAKVETATGQRREARPRGRPRVRHDESHAHDAGQGELGL